MSQGVSRDAARRDVRDSVTVRSLRIVSPPGYRLLVRFADVRRGSGHAAVNHASASELTRASRVNQRASVKRTGTRKGSEPTNASAASVPALMATALALVLSATAALTGQTPPPRATSAPPSDTRLSRLIIKPVPLRAGVGAAHESVTTKVVKAQQYYDQGLAYLHSFVWIEAARSFNEALRADPALAMGQLGLSYALAELGDSTGARAAIRRSTDLVSAVTPRERFRIELRAKQLATAANPRDATAAGAYRAHLDRIDTEFAQDVELLLIAGQMGGRAGPGAGAASSPHAAGAARSGSEEHQATAPGMRGDSASLRYYERARAVEPDYFAIDHYMAHAYENIGRPKDALLFAQRFATKAANVPHAHHMFGHVLRQVDRMAEAIAEFEKADTLHAASARTDAIPLDLDWHYRHNLDLLATSYQYVGKMTQAATLLKRSFDLQGSGHLGREQDVHKRAWPLFLLSRGRTQEALDAARTMQRHPSGLVQALGHILASRALQALGKPEDAAIAGNAALKQMRALGAQGGTLVPDFELAQGEYLLRTGNTEAGGKMLRGGVTKLMADRSPDAWVATVFQLEAAVRVARERGQTALAADLSSVLREHAPYYAGTHYALGLTAQQRGDKAAARTAYAEASSRWRDGDRDLPERVDVRKRLASLGS